MDLRFIVDGLEDSRRIEDKLSKRLTPNNVLMKSLESQDMALPVVNTGFSDIGPHLVSSYENRTESNDINAPSHTYVPLKAPTALQKVELKDSTSVHPPDSYYHHKHSNHPATLPSAWKNLSRVKPPIGLMSAAQQSQHWGRIGLANCSTPAANYCHHPGRNGISDNLTYPSNWMSYPSSLLPNGNLPGIQIYQIAYPSYETLDEKPFAGSNSNHCPPVASYVPAITPHTFPPNKHSIKQERCFPQFQVPTMNDCTSVIQRVHHSSPNMLSSATNSPISKSFFRIPNMPLASANIADNQILLIDANINTVLFDQHSIKASKNVKYGCRQCGRTFPRKCDTVRHVQTHLGIRPNICGVCGKRFIQRSALTIHLRVHTGEKPFDCSQCGRAFNDPSSLIKHRYTHQRNARINAERKRDFQKKASFSKHGTG